MAWLLRHLFFLLFIRPLALIVLGLNVRHRERLPKKGPAVLVANHNSHLDTMVLMTLFPVEMLSRLRPVAAADYFLKNRVLAWFALQIVGIVPVQRKPIRGQDVFAGCTDALARGQVLIFFPEGTRGEPERLAEFKSGIAHLAQRQPDVPIVPIFMHGLGKALPRGEALLVPFFCDVFVGEEFRWGGDRHAFMTTLEERFKTLADEGHFAPWE
jgi:1-acyl-sn-glycerol-3-phosphate acyltransferase